MKQNSSTELSGHAFKIYNKNGSPDPVRAGGCGLGSCQDDQHSNIMITAERSQAVASGMTLPFSITKNELVI